MLARAAADFQHLRAAGEADRQDLEYGILVALARCGEGKHTGSNFTIEIDRAPFYSMDSSLVKVTPPADFAYEGDVDVDFHVRFFDSCSHPRLDEYVRHPRQGGGARHGQEI